MLEKTKPYYLYEVMSVRIMLPKCFSHSSRHALMIQRYSNVREDQALLPVRGDVNQYHLAEVFLTQIQTRPHGRMQQMKCLLNSMAVLHEVFMPRLRKVQTSENQGINQSFCQSTSPSARSIHQPTKSTPLSKEKIHQSLNNKNKNKNYNNNNSNNNNNN